MYVGEHILAEVSIRNESKFDLDMLKFVCLVRSAPPKTDGIAFELVDQNGHYVEPGVMEEYGGYAREGEDCIRLKPAETITGVVDIQEEHGFHLPRSGKYKLRVLLFYKRERFSSNTIALNIVEIDKDDLINPRVLTVKRMAWHEKGWHETLLVGIVPDRDNRGTVVVIRKDKDGNTKGTIRVGQTSQGSQLSAEADGAEKVHILVSRPGGQQTYSVICLSPQRVLSSKTFDDNKKRGLQKSDDGNVSVVIGDERTRETGGK
ncbi:MAG: hypothetical protein AB1696_17535 [Planctomycetota bacterium]